MAARDPLPALTRGQMDYHAKCGFLVCKPGVTQPPPETGGLSKMMRTGSTLTPDSQCGAHKLRPGCHGGIGLDVGR